MNARNTFYNFLAYREHKNIITIIKFLTYIQKKKKKKNQEQQQNFAINVKFRLVNTQGNKSVYITFVGKPNIYK